jgi:alpha-N-arabinofuranosidase
MRDGYLLATPPMPDHYTGVTFPLFVQHIKAYPRYIDLVAMVKDHDDGDGADPKATKSIRVSVLNRHPTLDWPAADLAFHGLGISSVTVHEMYSDDLAAANTWNHPDRLVPSVTHFTAAGWRAHHARHVVRKHSWQFIIVRGS